MTPPRLPKVALLLDGALFQLLQNQKARTPKTRQFKAGRERGQQATRACSETEQPCGRCCGTFPASGLRACGLHSVDPGTSAAPSRFIRVYHSSSKGASDDGRRGEAGRAAKPRALVGVRCRVAAAAGLAPISFGIVVLHPWAPGAVAMGPRRGGNFGPQATATVTGGVCCNAGDDIGGTRGRSG